MKEFFLGITCCLSLFFVVGLVKPHGDTAAQSQSIRNTTEKVSRQAKAVGQKAKVQATKVTQTANRIAQEVIAKPAYAAVEQVEKFQQPKTLPVKVIRKSNEIQTRQPSIAFQVPKKNRISVVSE